MVPCFSHSLGIIFFSVLWGVTMNKKITDFNENSIDVISFLAQYYGIISCDLKIDKITHKNLSSLFPFLRKVSFDWALKNQELIYTGELVFVRDCNNYCVPYVIPKECKISCNMVSLDQREYLICQLVSAIEKFIYSSQKSLIILENNDDIDSYNSLLFQICVFLTRSLIREPIKSKFSGNIRKFLLDVLFPMIITVDDENNFAETEPEEYHQYINDLITDFKIKNFRTSACFLIKKICDKYEEMSNFMLSYCLEMINFLVNGGQIDEKLQDINIYLKNKDALINRFSDKKKLDFALLIILILRDKLKASQYSKNKLIDILVSNTDKIHSIPFPIIKI